ncbi:MAG: acyl-CoA dehydrogenase, partial [bacterium]|nr:acyl-CoA dehydrogenase [bacterium]
DRSRRSAYGCSCRISSGLLLSGCSVLCASNLLDGRVGSGGGLDEDQAIVAEGNRQNGRRSRVPALCDHPMRLPLQTKLTGSEFAQKNAKLGVEIAGAHGTLYKLDRKAPNDGHWPLAYMNSYGFTIAAGANEIQRNILGERVLGLAKSK